jgi:hypothetical protein
MDFSGMVDLRQTARQFAVKRRNLRVSAPKDRQKLSPVGRCQAGCQV